MRRCALCWRISMRDGRVLERIGFGAQIAAVRKGPIVSLGNSREPVPLGASARKKSTFTTKSRDCALPTSVIQALVTIDFRKAIRGGIVIRRCVLHSPNCGSPTVSLLDLGSPGIHFRSHATLVRTMREYT